MHWETNVTVNLIRAWNSYDISKHLTDLSGQLCSEISFDKFVFRNASFLISPPPC